MKTVFKEIIVILLLILAIMLILGVFLYDYIPMNKVVPKIEQYEVPNNIKEELEENVEDTQNTMTPIIYEINNSDLNSYEKTKDYQKGKVNPFADITTNTVVSTNTTTQNNGTTANTNNNQTITNSSSEGTYLPNKGTK